jgi:hypothetical protein
MDAPEFIDQNYAFNPKTEIFLHNGSNLSEGMVVLVADPMHRIDIEKLTDVDEWYYKLSYWHTPPFKKLEPIDIEPRRLRLEVLQDNEERDRVREAMRMNRWGRISNIDIAKWQTHEDTIDFVMVYDDGTAMAHYLPLSVPWLVRKLDQPYK